MKVTRKLMKRSIIKAAIDDYTYSGIDITIKTLNLIENVDTNKEELVEFLNDALKKMYDIITEESNELNIVGGGVIVNKSHIDNKLSRYFRFITTIDAYYGVIRMGVLFTLHEGDSYFTYDMSYLTNDFSKLYCSTVSFDDDDNVIVTNKMNKKQIKNSPRYGMKRLYRELAEDGAVNGDGLIYMSDGMGLNSDGEFEEI
jgi:hypothetical protein